MLYSTKQYTGAHIFVFLEIITAKLFHIFFIHLCTRAVEPPQVADVFSIDASKGVLIIRAQGEGLEPNGIQGGSIRVCNTSINS